MVISLHSTKALIHTFRHKVRLPCLTDKEGILYLLKGAVR